MLPASPECQEGLNKHHTQKHVGLAGCSTILRGHHTNTTFSIGSYSLPYSCRREKKRKGEKEQERRECFVALERPKIAPHTLTHTGVIVQQWESNRERGWERTHNMDGEKRESTEVLKEEEEAAMRVQVGQRMRRTWRKINDLVSLPLPPRYCTTPANRRTSFPGNCSGRSKKGGEKKKGTSIGILSSRTSSSPAAQPSTSIAHVRLLDCKRLVKSQHDSNIH